MATSASFSVSVHSANVVYSSDVLFDDFDVTLEGGRWTCVLGPSGVGKTTLLRLILGLESGIRDRGAHASRLTCSDGRPIWPGGPLSWLRPTFSFPGSTCSAT